MDAPSCEASACRDSECEDLSRRRRPSSTIGMTVVFSVCRLVFRRCHTIPALHQWRLTPSQHRTKGFSLSGSSCNRSASQKGSGCPELVSGASLHAEVVHSMSGFFLQIPYEHL
jgi:hypothetical protein